MLIEAKILCKYWMVKPKGVVHVGAHTGEESRNYNELVFGPCLWVEANPNLIPHLREKFKDTNDLVVQAAIWDESGKTLDFNVANNSLSSSLFTFGLDSKRYPSLFMSETISIQTKRLDEIIPKDFIFNFVNLDIQGAELSAIKSLGERIKDVDYIFSEVNRKEIYEGAPNVFEIDSYLKQFEFERVVTCWVPFAGWGDALYVRRPLLKANLVRRRIGSFVTKGFHIRYISKKIIHYSVRIPKGYLVNKFSKSRNQGDHVKYFK